MDSSTLSRACSAFFPVVPLGSGWHSKNVRLALWPHRADPSFSSHSEETIKVVTAVLYLRGELPFCRRLCCVKRLLAFRRSPWQSVRKAVARVRIAITMLKEKKALSRTYPIISSFCLYYRIVSVQKKKNWRHKSYAKEFLSAFMLWSRWLWLWTLNESAQTSLKLITGVQ